MQYVKYFLTTQALDGIYIVMDTSDAGKLGGINTLHLHGKAHFKRISKLAAEKRAQKAKLKKLRLDTDIFPIDKTPSA